MEQQPAAATAKSPAPATASPTTRWKPTSGWRDLLVGQCPRALFERIGESGDPLRLRQLCALRMRERALLLDLDRIHLRGLARVVATVLTRGRPAAASAMVEDVDLAITDVRRDDALLAAGVHEVSPGRSRGSSPGDGEGASAADRRASDRNSAERGPHSVFAEPFGLTEAQFRRACAAFNGRPRAERQAFFAMVIERRTMEAAEEVLRVPALRLAGRARAALESIVEAVESTGEVAR